MIDKDACSRILPLWAHALSPDGNGSDRHIFNVLRKDFTWAASEQYSVYYLLNPPSLRDAHHVHEFNLRGLHWVHEPALADAVRRHAVSAREHCKRGDLTQAGDQARAALAINPNHADSLHCLAQVEAATGKRSAALQHIRHALAVDDRVSDYFETMIWVLRANNQTTEANAALAAARRRKARFAASW